MHIFTTIFKKNNLAFCFILLLLATATIANAQNNLESKQALGLVLKNSSIIGLSKSQLNEVQISKAYHDATLDADLIYLQQTYLGVPIFNSIKTLSFKNDKVTSATGTFINTSVNKIPISVQATIKPHEAITNAARYLSLSMPKNKASLSSDAIGYKVVYDGLGISQENITTELMWVIATDNQPELCWQVKIIPTKSSDYWLVNVHAQNGKVISKINLTVSCNWDKENIHDLNHNQSHNDLSNYYEKIIPPPPPAINSGSYRVLPFPAESPLHGSFALVNDPWLLAGAVNNATTLGWHNDGTTEYNITRGNNVWSKEDRVGDNESTIGVSAASTTAAPYTFDFTFDPNTSPTLSTNQNAALTNLFYWNNIIHDITYQYGFDEVSGNFQNDNLGRGGTGGDYVLADAQDGSGTNNANFATPNDGSRPRMQMFLFSPDPNKTLKINSPESSAGYIQAYEVTVSANNKLNNVGPVTANVVLYDNGANQGCTAAAANAFAGKIVLIARGGTCNAQPKIKNAQNGGAVGVILYNADASPASPFSTTPDNSVTIPAVVITNANGLTLTNAVNAGTVNVTLAGVNIDGDLDNGVIVHEYGHGISNRLTGGPANSSCLINAEQMGEGWSDYYALMLTTNWAASTVNDGPNKRPIGNYAFGQDLNGGGIRTYPYSTDMAINPLVYATSISSSPHSRGEIWAATLWDMTWNIIAIDGINTNLYNASGIGGNSVALKLVTHGMKLQPCLPGFIDGRNAILKADSLLYNGKYSCAIWNAFARRGMGAGASQGSSSNTSDQTATFTLPSFNYDTTASVCNSFVWYDTTIRTSGIYTHTYLLPGGCSRKVTLNLTVLSVSSTFTKTNAGCYGSATGSITITPTSGIAPYTYRIGTVGSYVSSNTFNNLKAGSYRISILDANGCAGITSSIVIGQQPAITGTFTKTNAGCYASPTGSLTVTPTTGTSPYTYRLGTSGAYVSTNTFNNLKAGSYRVYIQDANNCIGSISITISQSPAVTGTVSVTPVTGCFGGSNGSITVTPTIGNAPFNYKLGLNGVYGSSNTFTGLKAGSYKIYLQDATGCVNSVTGIITQPTAVSIAVTKTDLTCVNSNDGTITATGNGGTPPYSFKFGTAGGYSSTNNFTNLAPGSYRVYIKDANNCGTASAAATILQSSVPCTPGSLTTRLAAAENASVLLSPNPSNGSFTLTTKADNNAPIDIRVVDVNGKIIYQTKGFAGQTFKFGDRFATGSYLIEIITDKQKETVKAIKIK